MQVEQALRAVIAVAMIGCGSSGGDGTPGNGPADAGAESRGQDFMVFTIATRAIDRDERGAGSVVLVVTSASGPSACALGDEAAAPVGGAASVLLKLDTDGGTQCPTGSYALDPRDGRCGGADQGALRSGCAVYRRWNDDGVETARLLATAGGAMIKETPRSGGGLRCSVELELRFPGGSVYDSFDIDFEGGANLPLCARTSCTPRCQPWQACGDVGACIDIACVDVGSSCPADGSPACCTYGDPYRQLACHEATSAPGERTCCVAPGDRCRYDTDCCGAAACQLNGLGTYTCR